MNVHYARRMPCITDAFGLFVDGKMIGCVTYGVPASNTLCRGIAGDENKYNVLELNRLVILPEYNGKNYAREKLKKEYAARSGSTDGSVKRSLIKPSRNMWSREISDFHLSRYAAERLQKCGITKVQDLYATDPKNEPGWYAVRELFGEMAKEL